MQYYSFNTYQQMKRHKRIVYNKEHWENWVTCQRNCRLQHKRQPKNYSGILIKAPFRTADGCVANYNQLSVINSISPAAIASATLVIDIVLHITTDKHIFVWYYNNRVSSKLEREMYELKTLLPQFDIKLPTCMYELKNVSLSGVGAAAGPAVVSVLKLL